MRTVNKETLDLTLWSPHAPEYTCSIPTDNVKKKSYNVKMMHTYNTLKIFLGF